MSSSSAGVPRSRRFVLRQFRAEESVAVFAARMGWPTAADLPGDKRRGVPRRLAWQIAPGATLNYFQDDALGVSYVSVLSGLGQEFADHLTPLMTAEIDVYDDSELVRRMDDAGSSKGRAQVVIQAGIGAPREFDERYYARFIQAAEDRTPAIREAAVKAMFYTKWPVFTETLADISESDPKKALREFAGRVLTAFGATGS